MGSNFRQIYRVWMGYISAINVMIPEDIEVNLQSIKKPWIQYARLHFQIIIASTDNIKKSKMYDSLLTWLQTGLLTSSGNTTINLWLTYPL